MILQSSHRSDCLHALGFHVFRLSTPTNRSGLPALPTRLRRAAGRINGVKFGTWATTVTPQKSEHARTARGGLANIGIACGLAGLVVLDEGKAGNWTAGS